MEPGIPREIRVGIGQVVQQGTVPATLDPTFTAADAGQLEGRRETLARRAERLRTEREGDLPAGSGQISSQMLSLIPAR